MYGQKNYNYDECITDILYKPPPPEPKPPRYVSKYRQISQPSKDKKDYGMMGIPKLDLNEPKQFLKKDEGVKKPIQKGEKVCFTGALPKLPERPTTGILQNKQSVNFVKRNIKSAQTLKPKQPQEYLIDCPDGHKSVYKDCEYIFGKKFGCVPQYLVKRNKNIQFAEDKYKNELENKIPLCKHLSKDEVEEMLKGLKEKWLKFNTYFTRLPLFIDTVSLVIKKNKIENTLAEIEKHIKFLEENHYIYVYDENDGNNEN